MHSWRGNAPGVEHDQRERLHFAHCWYDVSRLYVPLSRKANLVGSSESTLGAWKFGIGEGASYLLCAVMALAVVGLREGNSWKSCMLGGKIFW